MHQSRGRFRSSGKGHGHGQTAEGAGEQVETEWQVYVKGRVLLCHVPTSLSPFPPAGTASPIRQYGPSSAVTSSAPTVCFTSEWAPRACSGTWQLTGEHRVDGAGEEGVGWWAARSGLLGPAVGHGSRWVSERGEEGEGGEREREGEGRAVTHPTARSLNLKPSPLQIHFHHKCGLQRDCHPAGTATASGEDISWDTASGEGNTILRSAAPCGGFVLV